MIVKSVLGEMSLNNLLNKLKHNGRLLAQLIINFDNSLSSDNPIYAENCELAQFSHPDRFVLICRDKDKKHLTNINVPLDVVQALFCENMDCVINWIMQENRDNEVKINSHKIASAIQLLKQHLTNDQINHLLEHSACVTVQSIAKSMLLKKYELKGKV